MGIRDRVSILLYLLKDSYAKAQINKAFRKEHGGSKHENTPTTQETMKHRNQFVPTTITTKHSILFNETWVTVGQYNYFPIIVIKEAVEINKILTTSTKTRDINCLLCEKRQLTYRINGTNYLDTIICYYLFIFLNKFVI